MPANRPLFSRLRTGFSPSAQPPLSANPSLPDDTNVAADLDILEQVITQVEQQAAQQVVAQPIEPTPVPEPVQAEVTPPVEVAPPEDIAPSAPPEPIIATSFKEQPSIMGFDRAATPEVAVGSTTTVEQLPAPELPVEVEGYMQQVEDHQEQLPQEIVIADGSFQMQPPKIALKPVVVLPITPEEEKEGARKSTAMSFRWLVEWSRKIMKMFSGKVVYWSEPTETK